MGLAPVPSLPPAQIFASATLARRFSFAVVYCKILGARSSLIRSALSGRGGRGELLLPVVGEAILGRELPFLFGGGVELIFYCRGKSKVHYLVKCAFCYLYLKPEHLCLWEQQPVISHATSWLMDVPPVESERESETDSHPLLMEHVIGIPRDDVASTSTPRRHNNDGMDQLPRDSESSSGTTAASNSPNIPIARRDDNHRRRQQSLNSGFWISIELVVNLSQIIAAICVLSVSRNEHPHAPLFEWVIGYTIGCIATLPHLYWRYLQCNHLPTVQGSNQNYVPDNSFESNSFTGISPPHVSEAGVVTVTNGVSRNNVVTTNPRAQAFADHFKMALDCFFAVWFVVGNVWVFGGHSSAHDAPNLYRLCIAFLTFSYIGYAMPFILCALICCCLPYIISLMGFREDLSENRGATSDVINALGTYKFKSKKPRNGQGNEAGGGVFAPGTDKERAVSAEDAVCCICLARYVDNDDLRLLPCGHFFHKDCVDKWLKINALCPLCKTEIDVAPTTTPPAIGFGHRHSDNRVGNDIESQR